MYLRVIGEGIDRWFEVEDVGRGYSCRVYGGGDWERNRL